MNVFILALFLLFTEYADTLKNLNEVPIAQIKDENEMISLDTNAKIENVLEKGYKPVKNSNLISHNVFVQTSLV